jgi:hypothetical protein
MSVFVDVVNAVVEFRQDVSNFFTTGIYDLLVRFTAWFVEWYTVMWWKAKLAALVFSWDVAQQLIANLNISGYLSNAYSHLNSQTMATLTFFRIPEAINLILSAAVTKFVFRFLGF